MTQPPVHLRSVWIRSHGTETGPNRTCHLQACHNPNPSELLLFILIPPCCLLNVLYLTSSLSSSHFPLYNLTCTCINISTASLFPLTSFISSSYTSFCVYFSPTLFFTLTLLPSSLLSLSQQPASCPSPAWRHSCGTNSASNCLMAFFRRRCGLARRDLDRHFPCTLLGERGQERR